MITGTTAPQILIIIFCIDRLENRLPSNAYMYQGITFDFEHLQENSIKLGIVLETVSWDFRLLIFSPAFSDPTRVKIVDKSANLMQSLADSYNSVLSKLSENKQLGDIPILSKLGGIATQK